MYTPTHVSVAVAALGSRKRPTDTAWIIFGALLPDLPMVFLFVFDLARGYSASEIFDIRYFEDGWQIPLNFFNSAPIYALIAIAAYFLHKRSLLLFALAALMHIALDLPLHREDAHAHFWPLSDWKFISPVSYWDNRYHAAKVFPFEMALLFLTAYFGSKVFVHKWAKWLFLAFVLFIPAVSLFQLVFGSFS